MLKVRFSLLLKYFWKFDATLLIVMIQGNEFIDIIIYKEIFELCHKMCILIINQIVYCFFIKIIVDEVLLIVQSCLAQIWFVFNCFNLVGRILIKLGYFWRHGRFLVLSLLLRIISCAYL